MSFKKKSDYKDIASPWRAESGLDWGGVSGGESKYYALPLKDQCCLGRYITFLCCLLTLGTFYLTLSSVSLSFYLELIVEYKSIRPYNPGISTSILHRCDFLLLPFFPSISRVWVREETKASYKDGFASLPHSLKEGKKQGRRRRRSFKIHGFDERKTLKKEEGRRERKREEEEGLLIPSLPSFITHCY